MNTWNHNVVKNHELELRVDCFCGLEGSSVLVKEKSLYLLL